MPHQNISSLPSVRRQHLLVEFASLKCAAPPGMYLSLSPNDARLWWGVLFVRKGPFRGGIFKFTISFPPSYPSSAPTITFLTPVFHPLVQPVTPSSPQPGHFTLAHGFPLWFSASSKALPPTPSGASGGTLKLSTSFPFPSASPNSTLRVFGPSPAPEYTTIDVLDYVKSAFDDVAVLDAIPRSAVTGVQGLAPRGNERAWSAYGADAGEKGRARSGGWNERVRACVDASRGEGALYAGVVLGGGRENEEPLRFLEMDEASVETVKDNVRRALAAKEAV